MSELPIAEEPARPAPAPDPPKLYCEVCGNEMPQGARKCVKCNSYRDGRSCRACGAPMPRTAWRCGVCKAFQDWRMRIEGFQVVLALLAVVITVAGAIGPQLVWLATLPTDATLRVAGTKLHAISKEKKALVVAAINNGGRDAVIYDVKLDLSSVYVEPVSFEILNGDKTIVPANRSVALELWPVVTIKEKKAITDVAAALCTADVRLQARVEGSSFWGAPVDATIDVPVKGRRIRDWVLERLTTTEVAPCAD